MANRMKKSKTQGTWGATNRLAQALGITRPALQHWLKKDIVPSTPSRRNGREYRRFTESDVRKIALIANLHKRGFPPTFAREVADKVVAKCQDPHKTAWPDYVIVTGNDARRDVHTAQDAESLRLVCASVNSNVFVVVKTKIGTLGEPQSVIEDGIDVINRALVGDDFDEGEIEPTEADIRAQQEADAKVFEGLAQGRKKP